MNLSEAIRLGDSLPQITNGDFATLDDGLITGTCALGGALHFVEGITAELVRSADGNKYISKRLAQLFPVLAGDDDYPCPDCRYEGCGCRSCSDGRGFDDLFDFIVHLNDSHYWTRGEIADYVQRNYE